MTLSSYPTEVTQQVRERNIALPELPGYMKRQGPYNYFSGVDGARSVSVYEFDESKMAEAALLIGVRMSTFNDIPGFKVDLRICGTPQDAERIAQLRESL